MIRNLSQSIISDTINAHLYNTLEPNNRTQIQLKQQNYNSLIQEFITETWISSKGATLRPLSAHSGLNKELLVAFCSQQSWFSVADTVWAGLCVPNERWHETLPAPSHFKLLTLYQHFPFLPVLKHNERLTEPKHELQLDLPENAWHKERIHYSNDSLGPINH